MSFWGDKRVLVTGGAGFIGSHVVEALRDEGCQEIFVPRSRDYDLTKEENCIRLLEETKPNMVFHLAGLIGGIAANTARPADFFYQNLTMGTFMLHHSWRCGIQKLIAAGAGCGYPEHAPVPLKEGTFWDGYPERSHAAYALAKRLLHTQSVAYYQQHGFVSINGLIGNAYGPSDNFNLEDGHVAAALVRKFVEAAEKKATEVEIWGTGRATRDFIYAGDVAKGLLLCAEQYEGPHLVNISSGVETKISELVQDLAEITGFQGNLSWNTNRPDGQLRRWMDTAKATKDLGFQPQWGLREGLESTVRWYMENGSKSKI